MKYFIKKIYLISFFLLILLFNFEANARDKNLKYSRQNISNYFLNSVTSSHNYNGLSLNIIFFESKILSIIKKSNFVFSLIFFLSIHLVPYSFPLGCG